MAPARAAYLGGALLLAAWLASAGGLTRSGRMVRVQPRSPEAAQLDSLASDVQSQAARLRKRLATAPAPQTPIRNPFMFAAREGPARVAAPTRREARPIVVPEETPREPDLVLLGVAEDNTSTGLTRTAMIGGTGDELYLVTEGQPVTERYRVTAVGADAVELKDLTTGATRRLALKSPASLL